MRVGIGKVGLALLFISASTYSPGPPPKSSLNTYGPHGQDRFTYDAVQVDAHGTSLHVTFVAEYDGKDYPITGDPTRDAIFAERIDAYTTRTTNKKNGKITTASLRVISKDGQTMTLTTTGTNAQGQPVNNVTVYERQ